MKLIWLPCLLLVSCGVATKPTSQSTPKTAPRPLTRAVHTVPDLVFAEPGGVELRIDLHLPKRVKNPPLVMAIHGGGWREGSRKNSPLAWAARYGFAVASIEYRMSQEAVFPAQIHDCKGALRWLRANQKRFGYDASKVVVAGMSAGGHLAALMGVTAGVEILEGDTGGHREQSSAVQGVIDYFGPTDFIQRSKNQPAITCKPNGIVCQLLGCSVTGNHARARVASPVNHVGPGDPPLLIFHGEKDRQVLPAQSKRLLEVYRANGLDAHLHIVPQKGHGWRHPTPEEEKLVLDFLKNHLASSDSLLAQAP